MAYFIRRARENAARRLARGLAAALFGLIFFAGTATSAENDIGITIGEITRRLSEWRASFVNVRVIWELRSLPKTADAVDEWPPPPSAAAARLFARREWIWADHGLNFLEDWFFFHNDGSSKVHSINVFNGTKGIAFRAQFQKPAEEGPEKYLDLQISDLGTGKPASHIEHDATEGLYWPGFAEWLPEILSRWKWKLEEVEEFDGQPCARIAAIRDEGAKFATFEVLWLDLDHDCLVRRHRNRTLSGAWGKGRDFIVDEFQQLDTGIWFPKRGRSQLAGVPHENHLFVVTEAAVNESLDLARFDPPVPNVGTALADEIGYFKRTAAEGAPAVGSGPASQPDSAADKTHGTWRPFTAAPPALSWIWWSAALASIAVIFAALGFWLSRHRTGG